MSPSKFLYRDLFYTLSDHLGAIIPHHPLHTIRSTYANTNNIILLFQIFNLLPQNRPYVRSSMPTSRWRYDEMQAKLSQLIKLFLSKLRNVRGVLDNPDQADLLLSWMRDCILIRRGIVMQQGP
jgi:hypothetical protein